MTTIVTDEAKSARAATPDPDATKSTGLGTLLTHPLVHTVIVVAIVALGWTIATDWNRWTGASRFQDTDDAFIVGDTTPLAAQISGYIKTVAVDDYQPVLAGQLIAEIEPSDYQAQLDLATADLAAARANLLSVGDKRAVQRTLIEQAKAAIAIAEAELLRTNAEALRQRELLRGGLAGTEQLVEQADAAAAKSAGTLSMSQSQLAQQQALLTSLDATERELAAQVSGAQARQKLAQDNLGYSRIKAPADGLTGARQVHPGQFVSPGAQIITVMPMATLWVVANLKETQMTNVRVGDPARITVDAFPGTVLTGRVESWAPGAGSVFALLPPDNATGNFTKVVQRIPVKVVLDPNPKLGILIRPGMSVVATIDTQAEKQDGEAGAASRIAP
ncbi:MAG: HlyD family secretion protein [Beijerinckiaceae bacterium]|nr:HlyD family secretion protein [Beijerinckiaceae bacterium]